MACIASSLVCAQIRFIAVSDARQVLEGSSFQIRFELQNAEGNQFIPPDFSDFKVLSGPSRSIQTSIINGQQSSSMAYVYELLCPKSGTFKIGPARIRVGTSELKTQQLEIQVVHAKVARGQESAEVFIRAELDKTKVYAGEQCILSYKLYTRVSIENIEAAARPELDAFNAEWVNMLQNPVEREIYNGKEYMTKVLSKTVLFPIKTGVIAIEPTVYRIVKGERDPFGFGMPSFFQGQVETISSNGLTITVLPLPDSIPVGFSGAVGDMQMHITSPGNRFSLEDAIQFSIEVRGNANFLLVKPKLNIPDSLFEISDFKASDPVKVTDEPEIIKTCTYQFLLLPKVAGQFELAPEFVYFDPKQRRFITLTDRLNIEVKSEKLKSKNAEDAEEAGSFIEPMHLVHGNKGLLEEPMFYVFALLPFLTLGWMIFRNRQKATLEKQSGFQLPSVRSVGPEQELEDLKKAITAALCHRFPELGKADLGIIFRSKLAELSGESAFAKACEELLNQTELLKYSGQLNSDQLKEILQKAKELGISVPAPIH